jgi:NAD-specific glutamate dehydrogenase
VAARNRLLATMTDEVAELVLADNVAQARALTLDSLRSIARPDEFVFAFDHLAASAAVERADLMANGQEGSRGVPRPLLAVAMAAAKNWGTAALVETPLVSSARTREFLHRYFPTPIRERLAADIDAHPLRREIVATAIVNHVINHAGVALVPRLMVATGRAIDEVVGAYLETEAALDAEVLRAQVLAAQMDIERELSMLLQIEEALEAATRARLGVGTFESSPQIEDVRRNLTEGAHGGSTRGVSDGGSHEGSLTVVHAGSAVGSAAGSAASSASGSYADSHAGADTGSNAGSPTSARRERSGRRR